jgi:hypothetical protein
MSPVPWSTPFPNKIGKFRTLACVRDHILTTWPKGPPRAWHHVGITAVQATRGEATINDVYACLRIMKAHGLLEARDK